MVIEITVKPNQTIWDVCLEQHGSIEAVFEVLALNPTLNKGVNSKLIEGAVLNIDNTIILDREVFDYYKTKEIVPAGGSTELAKGNFNNDFNNDFN